MTFRPLFRPWILVVFLLLQVNCKKEEEYAGDTWSGGKVMILGHLGMGIRFSMPGDSYESISTAISIGCDGSEIDVQLTRDSILVAYHDEDLSSQTNCDGKIGEHDWTDIRDCKYTLATRPISLYSIEEIFERIPNLNDLYFSFDIKLQSGRPDQDAYEYRFLRAIRRLCDKYKMGKHVFLEGQEPFLDKARNMGLENKLFLLSNSDDSPIAKAKGRYFGISTTVDISAWDIESAYRNGLCMMVWAPGNYSQNRAILDKKPDIIQTDDPISILKLLKRFNYENTTP